MGATTNGNIIGHELIHATNYIKCTKYLDCGSIIAFRGTAANPNPFSNEGYSHFFGSDEIEAYFVTDKYQVPLVGEKEVQLLRQLRNEVAAGKHATNEGSTTFILSTSGGSVDITINLRSEKSPMSPEEIRKAYLRKINAILGESPSYLASARIFGLEQKGILESLRKELVSGKHTVNHRMPKFIVNSSKGPVEVAFELMTEFATESEARQFYLKMIDARLQSINMRLKAIEKRLAEKELLS